MKKNLLTTLGVLAMATAMAVPAFAADTAKSDTIYFASKSIRSWKAGEDDKTIYVQHDNRNWYRVSLLSPCRNIGLSDKVGFDFGNTDTFDTFSAVTVDEQYCRVTQLTRLDGAPQIQKN